MQKRFLFLAGGCLVWTLVCSQSLVAEESYHLIFSTYLGGTSWEHARDVFADAQGNVYICGGTASQDFPTTPGAHSQTFHSGDTSGDQCDAFVCKFGPEGQLIWSTYLGGPGGPAQNAYQSTFAGGPGDYGAGDAILAKLSSADTITLNPSKTYQTITGWEAVAYALEPTDPAFPNFKDTLFDQAVNDLGINRVRLEIRSGIENSQDTWSDYQTGKIDYQTWRNRRYATVNDNADPRSINWPGFQFSQLDNTIDRLITPLQKALAAKGAKLIVNLNYVAFTSQITDGRYIHNDPAEYAEFVLATYLHLNEKYGWVPDLWEVLLEPDNVSQWNGKLLGQALAAAAERLKEAGFEPAFVAPSNTNMGNAVTWFDQMIAVPGVLPVLREFSYHRYGGVSLANLQAIATRGKQYHLNTAMLEWWSSGNGYATLHEDLKIGNNSAWEQGALGGALNSAMSLYEIDTANPAHPRVQLGNATKFLRQYYKFVRPGAVRIEATSQLAAFDPVAFINPGGDYAVVIKCTTAGEFSLGGLPTGVYGVKYTTAGVFDADLPDQTISSGQAVTTAIPQAGVLTIYGKPALPDSQPPSTPTNPAAQETTPGQITLTWNPSTDNVGVAGYKIYHDGAEVAYTSQDLGTGTPQDDMDYPFTVGVRGALGPVTFLNGMIDDLRLYNRPLTAHEIHDLYNSSASQQ